MASPLPSRLRPVLRPDAPLAPLSSLGLGGRARLLADARDGATVAAALGWAREEGLPTALLAGGSNIVVSDGGFDGLVVRMVQRGIERRRAPGPEGRQGAELWTAAAGEPWDPLVERAVAAGLAGLECLSGIPGTAGATPIQNVGAYGREVAEVVESVRVLDRSSLEERELDPGECHFAYRDSLFRREPERFAVLAVTLRLAPGPPLPLRYGELERALAGKATPEGRTGACAAGGGAGSEAARSGGPTLEEVRRAVLALRRSKSMVLDPDDPNRRSVGSFFVNPVLPAREADAVVERAVAAGLARDPSEVPRFEAEPGRVKLAAGWLVERAGFPRGTRRGAVGVSSRHALALVHHGGGTTADLLALAREIRGAVRDRFGVVLRPEPVFLGFEGRDPLGDG